MKNDAVEKKGAFIAMIMKKKTYLRIVTALGAAALILGATDFYLVGCLRELDRPPAIRPLGPVPPPASMEIAGPDDDQDSSTSGSCNSMPEAAQNSRLD
jgi:hypothetical protein